jgi:hypothetical protein
MISSSRFGVSYLGPPGSSSPGYFSSIAPHGTSLPSTGKFTDPNRMNAMGRHPIGDRAMTPAERQRRYRRRLPRKPTRDERREIELQRAIDAMAREQS